jgi:hypothetical protein
LPSFLEPPHTTWRGLLAIRLMALAMRLDVRLIYILSQRAVWASGWRPVAGTNDQSWAANSLGQTWASHDPLG